ncbi:type III PLP-dependent enzyme [Candidatus Methylobacter oryzae]|uniref:Type III PLP-dependent enzyme n=1 Tax=Candidatus Methylobacter oryzae TaxID=2497749 RepID=A0ABY3C5W8_9GAMM|nr:type III PLP-dependent enzyme [Candidatus Methylobacter oryzae]TRW90642.1 type III PLP-dependent enzyme [Candidatus Methylobacter oryzae]
MTLSLTRVAETALLACGDEPLCAYIYDLDALAKHAAALAASLPDNCELFYAVKANSDLPILQTLAPHVRGFEVASGGELDWIRRHFPDAPVIFGGPGKLDSELAAALESGVELLHVESLLELRRLAWLARSMNKQADVLLRINLALDGVPATTLTMGGRATPFGIDAGRLPECLTWLARHPEIRLHGFHFHLMSHQLDAGAHLALLRQYFRQTRQWQEQFGLTINRLNVGGGIGINYREPGRQFDWNAFSNGLAVLVESENMQDWRIRFEPGRYLTAACGYYAMQVLDIKQCFGRYFAVGRGGTHHFRTPYAQGHSHPFFIVPREHWPYPFPRPGVEQAEITVVGQLCTPKDVLAVNAPVERLRVGDLLVFSYAGAYAWHISHHDFLRHPHPRHIYLDPQEPVHAANQ